MKIIYIFIHFNAYYGILILQCGTIQPFTLVLLFDIVEMEKNGTEYERVLLQKSCVQK